MRAIDFAFLAILFGFICMVRAEDTAIKIQAEQLELNTRQIIDLEKQNLYEHELLSSLLELIHGSSSR